MQQTETHQKKINFLEQLGTLKLMQDITAEQDKLETALKAENEYKKANSGYLASWGDDGSEIKNILAKLGLYPPDLAPDGKKAPTADQIKAWLRTQRTENPELKTAIEKQDKVAYGIENFRINIEMARKRLDSLRGLLALRTAQVNFLVDNTGPVV